MAIGCLAITGGMAARAGAEAQASTASRSTTPDIASRDVWSIDAPPGERRWIVIHDAAASTSTGVFHVEVLARKQGHPTWDVIHVVDHLAITADALRMSVRTPLDRGRVYPERFDAAYAKWKALATGQRSVCDTSIADCTK